MWPLEVVVLDEQPNSSLAVFIVSEHGSRQQFLPQRLPEPLDLPAGLRMLRPALEVLDTVAFEFRLELGAPAPRRVLAALIGEDLPRRAVVGDRARQRLQHQNASLVMRHRKAHQVAGVIVQERRHVQPLVPPQQEREDVRLPQLVRLGPLEVAHRMLALHSTSGSLRLDAFAHQHSAHRRLGHADPQEPPHQIPDTPRASARFALPRRQHRRSLRSGSTLRIRAMPRRPRCERLSSSLAIAVHPLDRRRVRHAQLPGRGVRRQTLTDHRSRHRHLHLLRPGTSLAMTRRGRVPRFARLLFLVHLSTPLLFLQQQIGRQVLGIYDTLRSRIEWFAAQIKHSGR
jgi:hypothetical protein